MPLSSADTAQILLTVAGFPEDTFRVLEFNGVEQLSSCFLFHVKSDVTDNKLDFDSLIGARAHIQIIHGDFTDYRHGIIKEFSKYPSMNDSAAIELSIVPRLALLEFTTHNRIFQHMSISEIIKEVLNDSSSDNIEFTLETSKCGVKKDFVAQYNETTLNFIQRLLEDAGCHYYFEHSQDKETFITSGANSQIPIPNYPELKYYPEVGMYKNTGESIFNIYQNSRLITGKITVKDYNYKTPDSNIIGQSIGKGEGEFYKFGSGTKNSDESSHFASLKSQVNTVERSRLYGKSDCRSLVPGYRFTLTDETNSGFSGDYLVVSVSHQYSQASAISGQGDSATYKNTFECIPAEVVYLPAMVTPAPVMSGLMTAKVNGSDGQYAFLDEQGQYKVKLPFDLSDKTGGNASCPVRMSQPHSGANYGIHFPVHVKTDIILGFENGDINRPIGLGTAPNPSMNSPVNSKNKSENIIRTATGHELKMDDLDQKTCIQLKSSGGHAILLQDAKDARSIQLKSTDANLMIFDDAKKNITIHTTDKKKVITLDNENQCIKLQTEYGHLISLDDKNKNIAIQTKNGHLLQLSDKDELITLKDSGGKHTIQIDAKKGAITISTDGDLNISAKGKLDIQAKEIKMEARQGGIDMKALKDINSSGMNINIKSNMNTKIEGGTETGIKGNMALKLEGGMTVESKAGLSNKMTGTFVNAEGSAVTTVKGAVVMIN